MDATLIIILLLLLVCPISMWLMMRGHRNGSHRMGGPRDADNV